MKMLATLLLLIFSLHTHAKQSYVRVYNFKSPYGVDWSAPRSLVLSALKNKLGLSLGLTKNKRIIGHNAVEISCFPPNGNEIKKLAGMASQDSTGEALKLLFSQNSGLGVLFHRFKGRLETEDELKGEIKQGLKTGDVNSMTYQTTYKKCQKLLLHFDKWVEKKAYLNYGLNEAPLKYTGAGCSAFAMTFLKDFEIAPKSDYVNWQKTVRINPSLIGPHNRVSYTSSNQNYHPVKKGEGLGILEILLQSQWASSYNKDAVELTFWSPDQAYEWVNARLPEGSTDLRLKN